MDQDTPPVMITRAHELHTSPWIGVFHLTGGGAGLLAEVLSTPGASSTVLEATVPYATSALYELLGREPEQACSPTTARQLAMAAFERAQHLGEGTLFGFGCTASLATNRTKKGLHRAHWAVQTLTDTFAFSATYEGERAQEETQLVEHIWQTLRHCLITQDEPLDDDLMEVHAHASPPLRPLLGGSPYRHSTSADHSALLLPGSFNPLHLGHREMLSVAEQVLGVKGAFELSVRNADKPSLDFLTINERLEGIEPHPVWLTNTPTFEEKARLFPGATFALGVDTLTRIGELRFYQNHVDLLDEALQTFETHDSHFLVFGRQIGERFMTLEDLELPSALRRRCSGVPEARYRNDISSTAIRRQS